MKNETVGNATNRQHEGWLILEDGWIPGRFFDLGQTAERDAYIRDCRSKYRGSFSYVRANMNGLRTFLTAVGAHSGE